MQQLAATAEAATAQRSLWVVRQKPTAKRRRLLLMIAEFAAMTVAFYALTGLIDIAPVLPPGGTVAAAVAIPALLVVALYSVGFYSREILYSFIDSVRRFVAGYVIVLLAIYLLIDGLSALSIPVAPGLPLRLVAITAGSGLLVPCVRLLAVHALSLGWLKRRLLIVGSGKKAAKLRDTIQAKLSNEAAIVAIVRTGEENEASAWGEHLVSGSEGALLPLCAELAVDEIVVARDNQRGMPIEDLLACRTVGIRVREYITFLEEEIGYIDVGELRPSALIFSWGFDRSPVFLASKRAFDVCVSLFLLVFTLPLTIGAAIAIRLDSAGPILFRQDRVGLDNRRFQVLKFRSMQADAEQAGPQWAAKKDSRVTRVGAILRKSRIDELPQLVNVLRGDMSFVGPRPERPFFVDTLRTAIPFYDERHKMKPGLTGWAQINYPYGASVEDAKEKLAYDLYYAKSASVLLDVLIALQTIKVVLFPRGVR